MATELPYYLVTSLLCLAASVLLVVLAWGQRRMALVAGLVGLPFLPFAALFNGIYWTTPRLGGLAFGLEDAFYVLAMGLRSWCFASLAGGATLAAAPRLLSLGRLALFTAAGLVVVGGLLAAGLPMVAALYAVPAAAAVLPPAVVPALRRPALAGALGCLLLGWAELLLWFWLWPEFRAHWRAEAWSGHMVLGVPFGDLVWAALFGAAHPSVLLLALRKGGMTSRRAPAPCSAPPRGCC